jgi:hypothetical protein
MICFHCGRRIELTERISFRAVCPECDCSLHVCFNCDFYDPAFHNQCREPQAERVVDKERANFCEYFSPRQTKERQRIAPATSARAKLESLFKKKL